MHSRSLIVNTQLFAHVKSFGYHPSFIEAKYDPKYACTLIYLTANTSSQNELEVMSQDSEPAHATLALDKEIMTI